MSQFTDYERVSQNYDTGRIAGGADVMAGLIQTHLKRDPKDISVLDVGCGTGNYAVAMLKNGIGKLTLMDASTGMLSKATEKINAMGFTNKMTVKQAKLPTIPFGDNTFDVVMINQVLHHLTKDPDGEHFPAIIDTFLEIRRVLVPSGLLVITTSTKEQLSGSWYNCLHDSILQRYSKKFPSLKCFKSMLKECLFEDLNFISVLGHDCVPNYTNLEGPLQKSYRDVDSYWDSGTEQEIEESVSFLQSLINDGKIQDFYEKHDKTDLIGYFTIIVTRKSANEM